MAHRIESVIVSAYMMTLAVDVARGAADGLDQRAARPQVALLVGVQDGDEAHLRQVEALAQQVDADDDVVDAEPQVAQDLDALQRVDLGVQVVRADAHLLQVVGQVLGHLLGQRRDERALAARRRAAAPRPAGRRSGPSSACTSIIGVDQAGRADHLLDDLLDCARARTGPGVAET